MVTLSFPAADHRAGGLHRSRSCTGSTASSERCALAAIIGPAFVATFVAVQWPFATFLVHSPLARGPSVQRRQLRLLDESRRTRRRRVAFAPPGDWPIGAASRDRGRCSRRSSSALGLLRGAMDDARFVDEACRRRSRSRRRCLVVDGGAHRKSERGVRRTARARIRCASSCVRPKSCPDSPK